MRTDTAAVGSEGSGRRAAILTIALALLFILALASCGRPVGKCVKLPAGSPKAMEHCGLAARRLCDEAALFSGSKKPGEHHPFDEDLKACAEAGIIEKP